MKRILKAAAALLVCISIMTGCGSEAGSRSEPEKSEGAETETVESKTADPETDPENPEAADSEGMEDMKMNHENMVQAVYPQMAPYPNEEEYIDKKTGEFDDEGFSKVFDAWWEQKQSRRNLPENFAENLTPFFASSIRRFLTEEIPGAEGENRIYSPVNVYMALSMLAETTDGNSRQQILDLLGMDSVGHLREQAGQVWEANYSRDGAVTSLLANSLWLDEAVPFKRETLDSLAENYYVSSYWGKMGSRELDERLQAWLNEQTGNLLKEQASGVHMSDDTLMALASTIYFRAKWSDEFSKANTKEQTFHGVQGDISCDFMHQSGTNTYYWGEKFGAVHKSLQESGGMWLILPDEGVTPEEMLLDDEVMDLILSGNVWEMDWENQKHLVVNLAMPKFDVVSNISLIDGLKHLGVTDVFDGKASDFAPLAEGADGIFLSQASHAARVMVDEEGCIAAAYTVMAAAGAAMPPEEEMDFVLDRPFLFVITSDSGMPLFAGIVNRL